MEKDSLKTLLITANVGSLFDDPVNLFPPWLKNFYQAVTDKDPDLIAIHCQEVGGKNFQESMPRVSEWISDLLKSNSLQNYDKARIFLDEDFQTVETFTALGSLYFVHSRVADIAMWDFAKSDFVSLTDRVVYNGSIEAVGEKEKRKFPQKFFPDQVWSRKGFMRTRWRTGVLTFDLVNVHLFHDASNIDCLTQTPSVYAKHRRDAFYWTLEQLAGGPAVASSNAASSTLAAAKGGLEDGKRPPMHLTVPTFVFGDFNFRLNMEAYVRSVTQKCRRSEHRDKSGRVSRVDYHHGNECVLSIGKKLFERAGEQANEFYENKNKWLNELDFEPSNFDDYLFEFPVTFPPTYPFSEGSSEFEATQYMPTRLPAWCDRILCSSGTRRVILCPPEDPTQYGVLGLRECMGDHKPVYLYTLLCFAASAADSHCLMENADFPPPPLLSRLLEQPGVQVKMSERNGAIYAHVRRDGATICIFKETAV